MHLSDEMKNQIIQVLVTNISDDPSAIEITKVAVKALQLSISYATKCFADETDRRFIMERILKSCAHPDEEITEHALICLRDIGEQEYFCIEEYFEQVCKVTGAAAKAEPAKVGASAFEFWTTLAEVETEMKQKGQPVKQYIDRCKGELLELIFAGILAISFEEDQDDDEWGHSASAVCCLQKFALLLQNEITEPVVKFVVANISEQNWKQKYAALMALGSITEGPAKLQFSEVIVGTAPILLDLFKDQSVKVREANSWVLSRICENHADVLLEPNTLKSLMYHILVALKDQPKISFHCCTALEKLAIACESTGQEQSLPNPLSQYY